jgi:hypothetical protein
MSVPWQAKPGCPSHLRDVVERFVHDREQRLRERGQLVINLTLGPRPSMSTALKTVHFGPEDVVQQRGEIGQRPLLRRNRQRL